MKKIYSFILIAVAVLLFAPLRNVQAQKETTYTNGMGYSKNISKPDKDGIYTISLEAFTTGKVEVTQKSLPADIVLVLDISGSMDDDMNGNPTSYNNNKRITALKNAVNSFIDVINDNDLYYVDTDGKPDKSKPRDQRLGNRIAIVTYSTNANNRTNGLIALGSSTTNNVGVTTLKNIVNGLTANGGTYAHKGMALAYDILSPLNDTRQLRTTVFFTDGEPGLKGDWSSDDRLYQSIVESNNASLAFIQGRESHGSIFNYHPNDPYAEYRYDTFSTANETIKSANQIKNLANDSKGIISNVYTISIINNPSNETQVYLAKTSSDWLGADNMGWYTDNWMTLANCWNYNHNGSVGSQNSSDTEFALTATTQDGLNDIFETIASSSGGSDSDLGGSSVAVLDIVSANFMLPDGADTDQIKVYTAPCTGGTEGALEFGTAILAPNNQARYHKMTRNDDDTITWSKDDFDVDVDIDVIIKGDKNNMIEVTGFDYSSNFCGFDENGEARGFKVVIEIPVKMDPNAVGGPNSESNESGSGIYADVDGDGTLDPIITYTSPTIDLPTNIFIQKQGLNKGESAHFKIQRIPKANPESTAWEDVTTVFLTRTETEETPIVKVRGLDPNYIYQVVEEPWSWSYTSEAITATRTDLLKTNPFKFKNTPKTGIDTKVNHAESKATNKFAEKSSEQVNSK